MNPFFTAAGASSLSARFPILGSHIERIGLARVAVGGGSMYLCIPILILVQFSFAVTLYPWVLRPMLGLRSIRWTDYIALDRHRIRGLSLYEKFNCLFCSYANGICGLVNAELDHLSACSSAAGGLERAVASLAVVAELPVLARGEWIGMRLIYDVLVSRPLGLHRTSHSAVHALLVARRYGEGLSPLNRNLLRWAKSVFVRFELALEQIESAWCPLRHFAKRSGIVYPAHHARFFESGEFSAMRRVLLTDGTVSDRKPTW